MSILLTGATGFLGRKVLSQIKGNCKVFGRTKPDDFEGEFIYGELGRDENHSANFIGITTVIHCAARVHVMNDNSLDPMSEFRNINTLATLRLARQAAQAKVKRFIFISSIKVNGEFTSGEIKFKSYNNPEPKDAYGISKFKAETGLFNISKETGMEFVIIRPSLVYGPGVKGNFLNLLKLCDQILPLPFGMISNSRSMIYIDNLSNLIITCIDHENAANRIFLASDNHDLSLKKLLVLIKSAMNRTAILLPVPLTVFKLIGKLMGKQEVVNRLIGNLKVDSSDAKKYLNWTAPHSVEVGIKATVDDFLENQRRL
jgi:nucleoside-diphosphate-sugar epimerase